MKWLKTRVFWFLIKILCRLEVISMKKIKKMAVVFAWLIVEGDYTISDFEGDFKEQVKIALVKIGYPELAEESK